MTPRLWHIALYVGIALAIVGGSAFGLDSCHQSKGAASEYNAAVANGEAIAHQSQAQASDSQVADLAAKLADQTKIVARVSGERDALLRKWNARPIPPDAQPPTAPDDRPALIEQIHLAEAVIAKDAETIAEQSGVIAAQSGLIQTLTTSRDEWKATAEDRERQAMAQESATKAWRESVTTSKWRGRVEGFAAGIASGYVAGRLR